MINTLPQSLINTVARVNEETIDESLFGGGDSAKLEAAKQAIEALVKTLARYADPRMSIMNSHNANRAAADTLHSSLVSRVLHDLHIPEPAY